MSQRKNVAPEPRRFGPPDYPPKVMWHGIHYATFERMFDRRVEGDDAWSRRVTDDVLKHREAIAARAARSRAL